MRISGYLALSLMLIFLVSCVQPKVVKPTVPFDTAAASYINKRGTATISGQAFLRQLGGSVVTCAGSSVTLIPATEYARQRMVGIYGSDQKGFSVVGPSDWGHPDYLKYSRETICDAQGNFSFDGVSDGNYYVTTSIFWQVSTYVNQGGILFTKATVKGGRDVKVLLAQ